jgi:hypothetical protein
MSQTEIKNQRATASRQPRLVRRCRCKYQTSSGGAWGYNLQKWGGGHESWEEIGNATHLDDVERYAQRFETVLIRCNGCGADIVREYPPNVKLSHSDPP